MQGMNLTGILLLNLVSRIRWPKEKSGFEFGWNVLNSRKIHNVEFIFIIIVRYLDKDINSFSETPNSLFFTFKYFNHQVAIFRKTQSVFLEIKHFYKQPFLKNQKTRFCFNTEKENFSLTLKTFVQQI